MIERHNNSTSIMTSKYNELVDHLVSTMPSNSFTMTYKERPPFVPKKVTTKERKSFDELYEEYSSKSVEDQVENLKELGRELVTRIDRIVDRLDDILEEDKKD